MTPEVAATQAVMAAVLLGWGVLLHPAAAFGHGARQLWPERLPAASLTVPDGRQQPLLPADGRGTLLVLGTTQCGATCTATMTNLQRVFGQAPQLAGRWSVRFVSIAVGEDDPVAAGCFSSYFDQRFSGGMLSPADTRALIDRLHFRTWQVRHPAGRLTWRHEPRVEVVDPRGRWLATYSGSVVAGTLIADLQRYDSLYGRLLQGLR
jgi:cytochrome oxidase Cu insertion factor (SCO1/SenC/PrrC family)